MFMGKKPVRIAVLVLLAAVNVLLLISCIILFVKLQEATETMETSKSKLSHEKRHLEDTIARLQEDLALKDSENAKLKEDLLGADPEKAAENDADDLDKLTENTGDSDIDNTASKETLIEKENEAIISYSPDEKYCAEASGTVFSVPAGGLYPYRYIHVWDINSDEIIWGTRLAGYTVEFTWSSDSRYLAVYKTGRIWGESVIIDLFDRKMINLPSLDLIVSFFKDAPKPEENRPDPYIRIISFEDAETVAVEVKWLDEDSNTFEGRFLYNFISNEILTN